MNVRIAWIAAVALLLVTAAWWLLSDFASTSTGAAGSAGPDASQLEESAAVSPGPSAASQGDGNEGDYPPDYEDNLPFDDAPPLPGDVAKGYVPTFEMPDLIGDGMLVPVEIDIGEPDPISAGPSE